MTDKTQPTAHAEITAPISADLRRIDDADAKSATITLMTEDRACRWAWDQVREDVGTKGWTAGDSCNFHGFFLWGWNYRGQYETQRPAAPPAPAAVAVPELRLSDEQIEQAFISARDEFMLREVERTDKKLRLAFGRAVLHSARAALAAAPAQAVAVQDEVDLPDVEDMAHSAVQEALSFGVNHDVFHRWMRAVMDKTVQALAAAPAQEHATQLAGQASTRRQWTDGERTLKQDVLGAIHDYSRTKPEEDPEDPESWESWFQAAFDLLGSRVGDIFEEHTAHAQAQGCTRSHPHEEMTPMCVLRTEIARLNHAAAIAEAKGDERTDALQDSAYAAGMLSGWNLCVADDHATFSKVPGERMTGSARVANAARAATAQAPASPAAHPHHCTARSADGACEECEGHAQAMAEWRAEAAAPAQAQEDARDEWEGIASLPNCDDLIWLYCQDTNTTDGPVTPNPAYADSWTHWAYAEAPSTKAIDAARAAQGGAA